MTENTDAKMDENKRCPYCKEEIKADARKCRYCQMMLNESFGETTFSKRYSDAYYITHCFMRTGEFIKVISVVAFILTLVLGAVTSSTKQSLPDFVFLLPIALSISLCLLGIMISASGQFIRAVLDIGVNTSQCLTISEKVKILSKH